MRAAQVRATLLWVLCALAAAQEGVPRRGPPRGPIKEDKSTFFGKEGDQSHPCGNQPAVRAAAASRPRPPRRRAVARTVASMAYFWLDVPHTGRSARRAPSRSSRLRAARCCSSASGSCRSSGRWSLLKLETRRRRSSDFRVARGVALPLRRRRTRPADSRRGIRNSTRGSIFPSRRSACGLGGGPRRPVLL